MISGALVLAGASTCSDRGSQIENFTVSRLFDETIKYGYPKTTRRSDVGRQQQHEVHPLLTTKFMDVAL
jgi:hypothetical protein